MKQFFSSLLLKVLLSVSLIFIFLEIGLRLIPGIIPRDFLIYYQQPLREDIARQQGLPLESDTITLERDDGGPPLRIFKPFTTIIDNIDDNNTSIKVTLDEIGFCNSPNTYQVPQIDIIVLGDSFTECHGVYPQDSWTSQLSTITGHTAYNLGRGKTGIYEYIQILKKFGLQKSPKIVIMNIYEGNDLRDAYEYYKYLHDENFSRAEIEVTPTSVISEPTNLNLSRPFIKLLQQYSYAYNLITSAVKHTHNYFAAEAKRPNFRYKLVFEDDVTIPFNLQNADTDEVKFARALYTKTLNIDLVWTIEDALHTFVELAQQHHFIPLVTYIPSAHTAYAANVVFEDPTLSQLMPWFSQEQRNFLKLNSEKFGYIFFDLTPALQTATQSKDTHQLLYYRNDLHLTPAGQKVVAETLSKIVPHLLSIDNQTQLTEGDRAR